MMGASFWVYARGLWRRLEVPSGRVGGWAGRARFCFVRRGRVQLARADAVLRGLRALQADLPTTVRDGVPLSQCRRVRRKRAGSPRCCCRRAAADARNALVQLNLTALQANTAAHANTAGSSAQPQKTDAAVQAGALVHTQAHTQRQGADDKADTTGEASENAALPCKELIVNEEDVLALRRFLEHDQSGLFAVDLRRFDADDDYKSALFYKINPLVCAERDARIAAMMTRERDSQSLLRAFAGSLGLRAVGDLRKRQRYRMRPRRHSDKENRTARAAADASSDKSRNSRKLVDSGTDSTDKSRNSREIIASGSSDSDSDFLTHRVLRKKKLSYERNTRSKFAEIRSKYEKSKEERDDDVRCKYLVTPRHPAKDIESNDDPSTSDDRSRRSGNNSNDRRRRDRESTLSKDKETQAKAHKGKESLRDHTKDSKDKDTSKDRSRWGKDRENTLSKDKETQGKTNHKPKETLRDDSKDSKDTSKDGSRWRKDRENTLSKDKETRAVTHHKPKETLKDDSKDTSEDRSRLKDKIRSLRPRNESQSPSITKKLKIQGEPRTDSSESDSTYLSVLKELRRKNNFRTSRSRNNQTNHNQIVSTIDNSKDKRNDSSPFKSVDKSNKNISKDRNLPLAVERSKSRMNSESSQGNHSSKSIHASKAKMKRKVNELDDSDADNTWATRNGTAKGKREGSSRSKDEERKDEETRKDDEKRKDDEQSQDGEQRKDGENSRDGKRPRRSTTNTGTLYPVQRREYSSLEDHAIVQWVSLGSRARRVNGNAVWRELQEQFARIAGRERTWHSLRNRYLRSILPALGALALPPARVSALRAAQAKGELKSRRRAAGPPPLLCAPPVRSAWGARPRPRLRDDTLDSPVPATSESEPTQRTLRSSTARADSPRKHTPRPDSPRKHTPRPDSPRKHTPRPDSPRKHNPQSSKQSSKKASSREQPSPTYSDVTRRFGAGHAASTPQPKARDAAPRHPTPHKKTRKLFNPTRAM